MQRDLPARPSLAQLKHQAKDLLKQFRANTGDAGQRFHEHHPQSPTPAGASLSDAQLVIAREYAFASWPRLKHHVEGLETVEARVARLRAEFSAGDRNTKQRLLQPAHTAKRFENYDPAAPSISDADACLLIANQEGYAFWQKYESYLHLDPAVQEVIAAVRTGDLKRLREILQADPAAANPGWVAGFSISRPFPNDSIPLFCVSEAVFRQTNRKGNEYELVNALIAAGADATIEGDIVLESAISFDAIRAVEALLDGGAPIDGVDGDGVPIAYGLRFGYVRLSELLAQRGAKLDMRFAAGVGRLDLVRGWLNADGSLKPGTGSLADPYGQERKQRGESPFQCERTRENILSQALCFACLHHRLEVAAFLVSRGANVNALVPGLDIHATILHLVASTSIGPNATIAQVLATVRFLLEHGADLTIRDSEYDGTPIDWASHCKLDAVADLLSSHRLASLTNSANCSSALTKPS